MGDKSQIEWTDATWNPVTGCSKVSPGCKLCYAERVFPRTAAGQRVPLNSAAGVTDRDPDPARAEHFRQRVFTDVRTHENRLDQPLHWKKPRRIFVNSMSDLFHEDVPEDFISQVFAVMFLARQHTFQILTKRPERMLDYCQRAAANPDAYVWAWASEMINEYMLPPSAIWPIPNVWLGVSVENQEYADKRIPVLLQTPAAVRFVSYEPALGPVDFSEWLIPAFPTLGSMGGGSQRETLLQDQWQRRYGLQVGLDWVIVGGESGPKARPFNIQWPRDVVTQCQAANVPVFVKQFGSNPIWAEEEWRLNFGGPAGHVRLLDASRRKSTPEGFVPLKVSGKGGEMSEWPERWRVREFPEVPR